MNWDLILYIIILWSDFALLAITIFQLICLWDLEADYMNPYESAKHINALVSPEFIVQGSLCAFFCLTGHWFMFLLTLPVACYHARMFIRGEHLVDVTEIFRLIGAEKRLRFMKLGFYVFLFFAIVLRFPAGLSSASSIFSSEHGKVDFRSSVHEF